VGRLKVAALFPAFCEDKVLPPPGRVVALLLTAWLHLAFFPSQLFAQPDFIRQCAGNWAGTMLIYQEGIISDSIPVTLEVEANEAVNTWKWKTVYHRKGDPVIKDYTLKLAEPQQNRYIIDEGDGIELDSYLSGNKLYSVFTVEDNLLTASYELLNDVIAFEVTSGRKDKATGDGSISNYSVRQVQKVLFRRNP
jgi:hypothetical protein